MYHNTDTRKKDLRIKDAWRLAAQPSKPFVIGEYHFLLYTSTTRLLFEGGHPQALTTPDRRQSWFVSRRCHVAFIRKNPLNLQLCSLKLFRICSVAATMSCGTSLSSGGTSVLLWSSVVTLLRRASAIQPSPPSDLYFQSVFSPVPSLRELLRTSYF